MYVYIFVDDYHWAGVKIETTGHLILYRMKRCEEIDEHYNVYEFWFRSISVWECICACLDVKWKKTVHSIWFQKKFHCSAFLLPKIIWWWLVIVLMFLVPKVFSRSSINNPMWISPIQISSKRTTSEIKREMKKSITSRHT